MGAEERRRGGKGQREETVTSSYGRNVAGKVRRWWSLFLAFALFSRTTLCPPACKADIAHKNAVHLLWLPVWRWEFVFQNAVFHHSLQLPFNLEIRRLLPLCASLGFTGALLLSCTGFMGHMDKIAPGTRNLHLYLFIYLFLTWSLFLYMVKSKKSTTFTSIPSYKIIQILIIDVAGICYDLDKRCHSSFQRVFVVLIFWWKNLSRLKTAVPSLWPLGSLNSDWLPVWHGYSHRLRPQENKTRKKENKKTKQLLPTQVYKIK